MASLSRSKAGLYTIQVCGSDRKRRSIRLGKVNKKTASEVRLKIEHLHACIVSRLPLDGETATWVAGIGDDLAAKLAAVGLIPKRIKAESMTLCGFIEQYIESKHDARPRSIINYQQAAKKLYTYFGADTDMSTITASAADQWVISLKKKYAPATVARLIKFAKQFYHAARREKIVTESPFADVKAGAMTNVSRIQFVTREEIRRVLDACPNGQWRLLIALARFGGLRCPSEILNLTWDDIDWDQKRFLVKSTKTAHYSEGGRRWVPLFPELLPHLEAEFENSATGTVYVINLTRSHDTNLRTGFERIILRAGLLPWTRLFQNLRASRETELAKEFPLHVATAWIGNSVSVAAKHYLSVTEADFERAVERSPNLGIKAVQNPVQSPTASKGQTWTTVQLEIEKALKVQLSREMSNGDCTSEYTQKDSNLQPSVP
jgi:integrase